jgi:hypothetical protein
MRDNYALIRVFKNPRKKTVVVKNNLSLEKAREQAALFASTPNSFVGFTKMSSL